MITNLLEILGIFLVIPATAIVLGISDKNYSKYIEYFSSLGGSPVKETQKLGQDGKSLMKLLGKNYAYNSKSLQAPSTKIEDCALHVLCRAQLKDLKLREYQDLFSSKIHLSSADDIVDSIRKWLMFA